MFFFSSFLWFFGSIKKKKMRSQLFPLPSIIIKKKKSMATKLILLAILVVSGHAQPVPDPRKCCRACCEVNGELDCQMGTSSCFTGTPFTAGGKCGPGNNNYVCEKGAKPEPEPSSGTATCGNPPVTCDDCCINGKCATSADCQDAVAYVTFYYLYIVLF